jgi:hypothetical protein
MTPLGYQHHYLLLLIIYQQQLLIGGSWILSAPIIVLHGIIIWSLSSLYNILLLSLLAYYMSLQTYVLRVIIINIFYKLLVSLLLIIIL